MIRRRLCRDGAPDPVLVPVIGQGTWNLEHDRAGAVRALRAGIDAGLTHIDTAEMYGAGEVEELVGTAIQGRRDEVFLASKVLPTNASAAGTRAACERSLTRLGTDHLDLYLLHWPGSHPLEETLQAFEGLRAAGKVRSYGVSNFDASELERAVALAGPGRIACNQVLYHLEERAIEHDVLPACERLGVGLVAYSPFGSGQFPAPDTPGGRVLLELGATRGVTAHQVALAFLLRDEAVFTIPKAGRVEHVQENAAAGDLRLTEAELGLIDAVFPVGARPASLPTI